jgi:hypothetical protein
MARALTRAQRQLVEEARARTVWQAERRETLESLLLLTDTLARAIERFLSEPSESVASALFGENVELEEIAGMSAMLHKDVVAAWSRATSPDDEVLASVRLSTEAIALGARTRVVRRSWLTYLDNAKAALQELLRLPG